MRRLTARGLAGITALLLAATACATQQESGGEEGQRAGFADCEQNPTTCNGGDVKPGGELTYAIEKNVPNWYINSAEGNVFETGQVMNGVLPSTFEAHPDITYKLNEDLMESAEVTSEDPFTIEYKIRQEAVWDDGTPISADDFDLHVKMNNGKDCPDCVPPSTSGYELVESVEGTDDGKAVTVTLEKPFTDWQVLFSGDSKVYPAHIAKEHGDLESKKGIAKAAKWFGENVPEFSGGPFKITDFQNNEAVALEPNEKWYGKTKPSLSKIIFRVLTEAAEEPTALRNDEVQAINPQPQVDLVDQVKDMPGVYYNIGKGVIWEHFDFNLKNTFLAEEPLRQAMFTAIDREAIIGKTVGQFAEGIEPLNSHNFVPDQEGYKDTITGSGQGEGDAEKAKQILTDAGYKIEDDGLKTPGGKKVPTFNIKYTVGNQIRQTQCELFRDQVKELGIDVKVEPIDDLGGVLAGGKYDIIVFAWVASPAPFNGAQQLWKSDSGSNFGKWVNEESDKLLDEAASLPDDLDRARDLLNQQSELMASEAYVLPLYQKPTFFAVSQKYANVRNNSTLAGPTYNMEEWGLIAQ